MVGWPALFPREQRGPTTGILITIRDAVVASLTDQTESVMNTEMQNSEIRELTDAELDLVSGGERHQVTPQEFEAILRGGTAGQSSSSTSGGFRGHGASGTW